MDEIEQQIRESFRIVARRVKSALDNDGDYYWFYIAIGLEPTDHCQVQLTAIELVEYHFLHESFSRMPNARVRNMKTGFEYRMWVYGFFRASADVVTQDGHVVRLPATKLAWDVTQAEIDKNGKEELSWD